MCEVTIAGEEYAIVGPDETTLALPASGNRDVMKRRAPLWLPTAVLALSGTAVSLQFTLTIPLLPAMPGILDVSSNDASWIVTITLLASAVVTPILSRMADMYGKRRMIVIALVAMTMGSVVIAVGGDAFATMLVGRGLQGFAQSLIPIGISLLRDLLPRTRVGSAVALMSATLGIGAALGMPLSGLLYEGFGWESVFWFSAASGGVFIVGTLLAVDESPVRSPARFDLAGALMLSVILTATLLVISKADRWELAVIVALIGIAGVGFAVWIPLQLRVGNPMVDLRTMTKRPVLLTNLATLFVTSATFINMLLTTQQVQAPTASGYGFGLSAVGAGLVMLPAGVVMVALAPLSGGLLNRWGGRSVLIAGSIALALAYVFRVLVADTVWAVVIGATLVGVGTAFAFAALPTLIMASVPLTETASANGINALVRSLAMSTGSAFLAFLVSSMSVSVGGYEFLSAAAIQLCFWLAAACGLLGAAIAAFIPVDTRIRQAPAPSATLETVIRGRVILGGDVVPRQPAIVTFMNIDGTPVDWSRADLDGHYSALLPGPGRYLAVANAAGWAPRAHVVDVTGTEVQWDAAILEQLTLSGRVTGPQSGAAGAIVSLHRAEGTFVTSVRSDAKGSYQMPLPMAGPYVVTAIDPAGAWAHSQKLIVGVQPATLDIVVPV